MYRILDDLDEDEHKNEEGMGHEDDEEDSDARSEKVKG